MSNHAQYVRQGFRQATRRRWQRREFAYRRIGRSLNTLDVEPWVLRNLGLDISADSVCEAKTSKPIVGCVRGVFQVAVFVMP